MKGEVRMEYKKFRREPLQMPHCPDVLRVVDARNGIVYINVDAAVDANIVLLLPR